MRVVKKHLWMLVALCFLFGNCGMFQTIIKSSFPYTTTLVIPSSSKVGKEYSVTSMANSFDQNFSKSGNNGDRISEVRIVSAKLQSIDPSDYNIGNWVSARIYMSKSDGSGEVLVATRNDITENVGNSIVLDINNGEFLDDLVRLSDIRVRLVYKLRTTVNTDVSLHVVLGLGANPN